MVESFDFEAEAAEIEPGSVKSIQVQVLQPSVQATVSLVTLEELAYELDWTVQSGLKLTKLNGEPAPNDLASKGYEDLNQFCQSNS